MKLIASVDSNWGLGCGGSLLFRIPDDLRRFRALTTGNVVVMGRKTLESLPNGPLPNRENIVLTREAGTSIPGAHTCRTLDELWEILRKPEFAGKETYVIGGAQIYALLLPYCEEALITHVRAYREADCLLPALSQFEDWALADISPWQEHDGLRYAYATYVNLHPLPPG
jgi:dihydrofolate reductase